MSVQDPAESGDVVTLYFDGNPQTFLINDLAVALALFLNPGATPAQIQQVARDIFGLSLTPAQITGAGPNPLANFDLNGDGIPGTIEDFGVAVAALLGTTTIPAVEEICMDLLSLSCDIQPGTVIPGSMGATPFPISTSDMGLQVEVSDLVFLETTGSLLARARVTDNGSPVAHASVDWGILGGSPASMPLGLGFFSSITDADGLAFTVVRRTELAIPLSTLTARVNGVEGFGSISSSSISASGFDFFLPDPLTCGVGEQVGYEAGIAANSTTGFPGISPLSPSIIAALDARVATAADFTILNDTTLQITVDCRTEGSTTLLVPGVGHVGRLEVDVLPAEMTLDLEVFVSAFVASTNLAVGRVEVRQGGIPVVDTMVSWSVLAPSQPAISALFSESVTDENGIARTVLQFPPNTPPFQTSSRLVAEVNGQRRSAPIMSSAIGGSGGLSFTSDPMFTCRVGEEISLPVMGIPDTFAMSTVTVPPGVVPDLTAINARIAQPGSVTILAEPPQETRLFEVAVDCRDVGTTTLLILNSLNSLPLIEIQVLAGA